MSRVHVLVLVRLLWLCSAAGDVPTTITTTPTTVTPALPLDVDPVPPMTSVADETDVRQMLFKDETGGPKDFNAAWVHDAEKGLPGMWATELLDYNKAAKDKAGINMIFIDSGDFEWSAQWSWDLDESKWHAPYGKIQFDDDNIEAAETYKKKIPKSQIVPVIKGDMADTHAWGPDLSKRSYVEVVAWADKVAAIFCSYKKVDGLHVELKPTTKDYTKHLLLFIDRLSSSLRSRKLNCVSRAHHPHGRSISFLGSAEDATPELWEALGPNGFFVLRGFDLPLQNKTTLEYIITDAGTPSDPKAYATAFASELKKMKSSAAKGYKDIHNKSYPGFFMVGIPASGTAREFEAYTTEAGDIISGFSKNQAHYVKNAFDNGLKEMCNVPQFLGVALRSFASQASYPQHTPGHPFANVDTKKYLLSNLGCDRNKTAVYFN